MREIHCEAYLTAYPWTCDVFASEKAKAEAQSLSNGIVTPDRLEGSGGVAMASPVRLDAGNPFASGSTFSTTLRSGSISHDPYATPFETGET